ncbi:MAG: hypothetical protein HY377_02375 [Candidatus Blackburnbacteria bacterium]|nr:hypothetical protein [Candidatus Blackburnbacteria bacterium]
MLLKELSNGGGDETMMMHGMGYALGATDSAGWNNMADVMREMMGPYRSGGGLVFWQLHWLLELITWALLIALLVGLIRWVWKKGNTK